MNPELAPFGDILWRSQAVPLSDVLATVEEAYTRFYDPSRLKRVLARVPSRERRYITASYVQLRSDRPKSWGLDRAETLHGEQTAA